MANELRVARGSRSRRVSLVAAALGALLLAGCQTDPNAENLAMHDYRLRHPIVISEQAETFDLPVGAETRRLSRELSVAVVAFAHQARAEGAHRIDVMVPSGSGNEAAAHAVAADVRHTLAKAGVPPQNVDISAYPVDDRRAIAPIRIAYPHVTAAVHACGRWTRNIASGASNAPDPDYGCATQSNLAAMIDNPADLIQPRKSGPADRSRRDVMHGKYRAGEKPSGEYKEGVGAKVSDVGN